MSFFKGLLAGLWISIIVMALLAFAGCSVIDQPEAAPQPAPPNAEFAQNRALEIVWHEVYGMPWHAGDTTETYDGPAIFWHFGETCGDGPGWHTDDYGYGAAKCALGHYHDANLTVFTDDSHTHANGADIEWTTGKFSDTCLAHELGHARQWYLSGDTDHDHNGGPFDGSSLCNASDKPDSLVAKANAALQAEGL